MTYATAADMSERYGAGEMDALGADRVVGALADATTEMDACLGVRYELPLDAGTAASPLLARICCAIARYLLYDDVTPDAVAGRAKHARRVLASLADGSMVLPGLTGRADARLAAPELAERTGPEPVMTTAALEGL